MHKVIYMTGAPAAGKSTTGRVLAARSSNIVVFEYGAKLTEQASRRQGRSLAQTELREKSSILITKEDVDELDQLLVQYVARERQSRHVIIDSHPVTKESYGFRITPFSAEQVKMVGISEVWVLYASADETIRRIRADAGGRPLPTATEADMHTLVQANIAATYSILVGVAAYLFDTAVPPDHLYEKLLSRLE